MRPKDDNSSPPRILAGRLGGVFRYARIWWCLVRNSFYNQMSTSLASAGYLIGKIIRFAFFLIYLLAIFNHIPSLKGYSMPEVVIFFMVFNFIDVGAQFLFRGLYGVKTLIDEGDFDKILTQPAHPLFRISWMGVDFLDLFTLIPIIGVTFWAMSKLALTLTFLQGVLFAVLLVNGLVIAYSFHVVIGAFSVRTQALEGAIWVYRDITTLGRFPVSIYSDILRWAFVTVAPIAVMISFPAQALLGLLSASGIFYAFLLGLVFYGGSTYFWKRSLMAYTSISG